MARADFYTSLGLIVLGAGAAFESYRMPRMENLTVNPYTAPGIVPGLIGLVLVLLGLVLAVRSVRRGGARFGAVARAHPGRGRRLWLALALTVGYAAGLVGTIPFWLATGLFTFGFIVVFEWRRDRDAPATARALTVASVQAVLVAVTVTLIFQELFLVRLP